MSYFATVDIWVGNLDSEADGELIQELVTAALANYQATVDVSVHPDDTQGD
jgi:hypothetical protein